MVRSRLWKMTALTLVSHAVLVERHRKNAAQVGVESRNRRAPALEVWFERPGRA